MRCSRCRRCANGSRPPSASRSRFPSSICTGEDLPGGRRGPRRAARVAGKGEGLRGRRLHSRGDGAPRLPAGRQGFPGVPASADPRRVRARAHRAEKRARLQGVHRARRARRDAGRRSAPARPDHQRHREERRREADRPFRRLLRHVSEAFAEDPVRILRLARFAARFGFDVAPQTMELMQRMVASGETDYLVPERVWQEFAKGLMEREPQRMFEVLEMSGLRRKLLPELGRCGQLEGTLAQRFARLAWPLKEPEVEALCDRLKVPGDVRELALLACRNRVALRASRLATPQALLELLKRTDAFRRPERFQDLLAVARRDEPVIDTLRLERAFAAAAAVDAGAIAAKASSPQEIARLIDQARADAIARAV